MVEPTTLNGRTTFWSLDHERCIGWGDAARPNACKFPGSPHKEGGRCMRCASRHSTYMADRGTLTTPIAAPSPTPSPTPSPAPAKRWSRNHDACIGWDDVNMLHHDCSTSAAPHVGNGRCQNCAHKELKAREKAEMTGTMIAPPHTPPVVARATAPAAPVFEVFTQTNPIRENGPALTLRKDGSVTINAAAYELLDRPNFVELLYARDQHILGIRTCAPTVAHARIIQRDKGDTRTSVSTRSLLKFYGIDGAVIVRGTTRQYGDVLAVQLTTDRARG